MNGVDCTGIEDIFPYFKLNFGTRQTSLKFPFEDFSGSIDKSYQNYSIHLFKKRTGVADKDFFQVCYQENSKCFAFLFPIKIFSELGKLDFIQNVLEVSNVSDLEQKISAWSSSTDSKEKTKAFIYKHTLYTAFRLLLEHSFCKETKISDSSEDCEITNFFDEETYILLSLNSQISKFSIKIEDLFANLYASSFMPVLNSKDFNSIHIENTPTPSSTNTFSKITLNPISPAIAREVYIQELFENILKTKLHALVRFHLLYQVIEFLMNDIGMKDYNTKIAATNVELSGFIGTFSTNVYHDAKEKSKDIKNTFPKEKSEKELIHELIKTKLGFTIPNYPELSTAIEAIQSSGITDDNLLGEKVYFVRNLIVHGYHRLKSSINNIDGLVEKVNEEFEKLIVKIVIKYS